MKIVGYGICGEGEARRYMRQTLDEFKRLCDEVVILCNNASKEEEMLIDSYGFRRYSDKRQWGHFQWRIKQDFLSGIVSRIAEKGDMMVCLDMDEVLDKNLTRDWLLSAPFDAYHVYVVDLWEGGYKPESCFWNVRLWRWTGETKFRAKPVHCGLAPEWAYLYHRHAPFILKHYGLIKKEDRERRIARYKRFDPHAEHLDRKYYDMLASDTFRPFDEDALHETVAAEVATYKQTKPTTSMTEKKQQRFAYVENPHGVTVDIPEKHLAQTLKRPGFKFIGYADEMQEELDEMFADEDVGENDAPLNTTPPHAGGSYQKPAAELHAAAGEPSAPLPPSGTDVTPPESPVPPAEDDDVTPPADTTPSVPTTPVEPSVPKETKKKSATKPAKKAATKKAAAKKKNAAS